MTTNELTASLREFISENFLYGAPAKYADDDSLLENSIIDSTGVLELIMHLETTFELSVDDEELVPDNLDSIANLARFIERKREAVHAPA